MASGGVKFLAMLARSSMFHSSLPALRSPFSGLGLGVNGYLFDAASPSAQSQRLLKFSGPRAQP